MFPNHQIGTFGAIGVHLCSKCRIVKPAAQFSLDSRRKTGLQYRCKACVAAAAAAAEARRIAEIVEILLSLRHDVEDWFGLDIAAAAPDDRGYQRTLGRHAFCWIANRAGIRRRDLIAETIAATKSVVKNGIRRIDEQLGSKDEFSATIRGLLDRYSRRVKLMVEPGPF